MLRCAAADRSHRRRGCGRTHPHTTTRRHLEQTAYMGLGRKFSVVGLSGPDNRIRSPIRHPGRCPADRHLIGRFRPPAQPFDRRRRFPPRQLRQQAIIAMANCDGRFCWRYSRRSAPECRPVCRLRPPAHAPPRPSSGSASAPIARCPRRGTRLRECCDSRSSTTRRRAGSSPPPRPWRMREKSTRAMVEVSHWDGGPATGP